MSQQLLSCGDVKQALDVALKVNSGWFLSLQILSCADVQQDLEEVQK